MDGDLYLIKLVRNRPVIWDQKLQTKHNNEARESAWTEIANKIGTERDWIKSRWYSLYQRFLVAWKSDNPQTIAKFKYYMDMTFLKPVSKQLPSKISQNRNTPEFIITKKELDEYSDDSESIFMEISTESEEPEAVDNAVVSVISQMFGEECDSTDHNTEITVDTVETNSQFSQDKQIEQTEPESVPQPTPNRLSSVSPVTVKIKVETDTDAVTTSSEADEHVAEASMTAVDPKNYEKNDRCEDTIFGELVTAMLKRMPEAKKKQAKKEIMNVLLS